MKKNKYHYTVEGIDGIVYGTGTVDRMNGEIAADLVWENLPTNDSVIGWDGDKKALQEMCFTVAVSNSDDYYVTFAVAE